MVISKAFHVFAGIAEKNDLSRKYQDHLRSYIPVLRSWGMERAAEYFDQWTKGELEPIPVLDIHVCLCYCMMVGKGFRPLRLVLRLFQHQAMCQALVFAQVFAAFRRGDGESTCSMPGFHAATKRILSFMLWLPCNGRVGASTTCGTAYHLSLPLFSLSCPFFVVFTM